MGTTKQSDMRSNLVLWFRGGFACGFRDVLAVMVSRTWYVGCLAERGLLTLGLGWVLVEVVYGD